jgi:hypothetical protein
VVEAAPEETTEAIERRWRAAPPFEHDAFWKSGLVETEPVSGALQIVLVKMFADRMQALSGWPFQRYSFVRLDRWLARQGPMGEHLVVTNLRGEKLYLTRADIERHAPVIVVGLDDERNLNRYFVTYQLDREYSWRPGPKPPLMVRTLGPFLFFRQGPPPPHLEDTTMAGMSLEPSSFQFTEVDPLRSTRAAATPELASALLGQDCCLKCHALRGEGAHAHHVRARDGKAHGGFALALESYPPDVLRRFLFEQDAVAASFGVTPLPIDSTAANVLFDFVRR